MKTNREDDPSQIILDGLWAINPLRLKLSISHKHKDDLFGSIKWDTNEFSFDLEAEFQVSFLNKETKVRE